MQRSPMNRLRRWSTGLLLAVGCGFGLQACMPDAPQDDNGDLSFVRQAVPLLLGRKPKGADEVEFLADLAGLVGREGVVRLLMEQPEFTTHWTAVLLDDLQLQQDDGRAQSATCFRDPLRGAATPDLANFIINQPVTAVAPGGNFNMIDVIGSAIAADDLSVVYLAYPIPLGSRPDQLQEANSPRPAAIGNAFNHVFLNHQVECLLCHNSDYSASNVDQWQRTWAIPLQLESAVYGNDSTEDVLANLYAFFRTDQFTSAGSGNPFDKAWGMDPSCARITKKAAFDALPNVDAAFAGVSGKKLRVQDLIKVLQDGTKELKATGLERTSVPGQNPTVPSDQGFGYMVAATITENVWEDLTGQRLTIANYYPRNQDQRDALWSLTENTFIGSGWSLKDLIAEIMLSPYFNRHAPETGAGSSAYRMPMIFDPWVQHDPRIADPNPDPKNYFNGQGELVHRYAPQNLLHSVAAALDWPEAERFPFKPYPSKEFIRAIGQYVSDYQPGTRGVDLQGLLNWESQLGSCQKPASVPSDWIDHMLGGMPAFDAAHPGAPLTVADVIATTKDWLVGDGTISSTKPDPVKSEEAALAALFGVPLNTTASGVADLGVKVRRLCGILLETPKFLLAGIESNTGLNAPRLRVCNGAPCTYLEICESYQQALKDTGHPVLCADHDVFFLPDFDVIVLEEICPYGNCIPFELDPGSIYEHIPNIGVVAYPAQLPVPKIRWFDARRPVAFMARAEGARVGAARGVTVRGAGEAEFVPLQEGAVLKAGDVLSIPGGAVFAARTDMAVFATPKAGMSAKSTFGQSAADREFLEAVEGGKSVTVDALLARGAGVNARDRYGETALMKAAAAGNVEMMTLLLERGADASARAGNGLAAADFAASAKQAAATALLAKHYAFASVAAGGGRSLARTEEPWLFYVASTKPVPAPREAAGPITPADAWALALDGKLGTKRKDLKELEAIWQKPGWHDRGTAGPLLNAETARRAWDDYVASGAFAKEHPSMPAQSKTKSTQ